VVWWSISIKLCWYGGVFPLNFHQSLMEILQHTTKVLWKYSNIPPKFNGNTPTYTKKVNGNTPTYQQSSI
jgi:hypothetical protein